MSGGVFDRMRLIPYNMKQEETKTQRKRRTLKKQTKKATKKAKRMRQPPVNDFFNFYK